MTVPGRVAGRDRADAGVTLVELLVALAVLSLAMSAVAMMATAVLEAFDADPAAADAQQRARAGVLALVDDIQQAGSGFVLAAEQGPGRALPALWADGVVAGPWTAAARARTLTTWHAPRGAAHALVRVAVPAGRVVVPLDPPAFCAAPPACGFRAGDDVVVYGADGQVALATVRQVVPPFDLDLLAPLPVDVAAGAVVAVVVAHTYELRADAATGLAQIVRRLSGGPATPVIDFVTRFDIEWWGGAGRPAVTIAPGGLEEDADAALPPPAGVVRTPAWPAGENCAFARDGAGAPFWRGAGGGPAAAPLALTSLADGPWCPSPAAAVRWDADLTRVTAVRLVLGVSAAADGLRPGLLRRPGSRLVPDLVFEATVRPGRLNGGV